VMDPGGEQWARLSRFAELVQGDPRAVPLDQCALAISAVLRSRPTDDALAALDDLARRCPEATFPALRAHVFDDLGFVGDRTDYDNPRNSFLDVVLERRRGLPILLATVMIELGRRIGVPVVGVGMPMHFLVRSADDDAAFVDPFSGQPLDREGARDRFETLARGQLAWDERHLVPTPARLMIVRMLTNLGASYERRHDRLGVALVAKMRAAIPELAPSATTQAVRLGAVLN